MEEHAEKRGIRFLLNIARINTEALVDRGIDQEQAREIGLLVAEAVRVEHGGEPIYVPKGLVLVISARDREIWSKYSKYNGPDILTLAKEHDLTERQVYSIVARCREEDFNARQGKLFG